MCKSHFRSRLHYTDHDFSPADNNNSNVLHCTANYQQGGTLTYIVEIKLNMSQKNSSAFLPLTMQCQTVKYHIE